MKRVKKILRPGRTVTGPLLAAAILAALAAALLQPALALPDDIYITIPPGGGDSVVLVLPDDSGWAGRGEVEYNVTMEPGPARTWSDFSEQIVSTDENNTVLLPVNFRKSSNASCGERFTLAITSSAGTRREIRGGACESAHAGVSTAPAAPGQGVASALNQNFGMLDVAFSRQGYAAEPGAQLNITALASSHQGNASLRVVLSAGPISISPAFQDIGLGPSGGQAEARFLVQAPDAPGTYDLALTASLQGCALDSCSITRHADLVVGGSQPDEGGVSVLLFPGSISVSRGMPASFRLSVRSNDIERQFNISIAAPFGVESSLAEAGFSVPAGGERWIDFNITASGPLDSYRFTAYARYGDDYSNVKQATGYINIDGMEAGAERALEFVENTGNADAMAEGSRLFDSFLDNPTPANYAGLQDELARLEAAARQSQQNQTPQPDAGQSGPSYNQPDQGTGGTGIDILGRDIWILAVIAAAGLALSLFFYKKGMRRGHRGSPLEQEFEYNENPTTSRSNQQRNRNTSHHSLAFWRQWPELFVELAFYVLSTA